MNTTALDESKKKAFAGDLMDVLNKGSLSLMIAIGHQTELFDKMAELPASTSEEVAKAANLNERYVREWLNAMVVGKVVDYDAEAKNYHLPPEHAASLTRAAGAGNLAPWIQFVPYVAQVQDKIIECFRNGGGVPYSEYKDFAKFLSEGTSPLFDAQLIDVVLPMAPGLVDALKEGIDVLEVGCGSGHALGLMAQAFPNSRFTGYNFLEDNVEIGETKAKELGLSNFNIEAQDVAKMDAKGKYDLVTAFDMVHDQAQPAVVLKGVADALKPGGTFLMSDMKASTHVENNMDHPMGVFGYSMSTMHCMTVSLAYDGVGLGAMWGEEKAKEMLAEAGMEVLDVKQTETDPLNNFYISKKP